MRENEQNNGSLDGFVCLVSHPLSFRRSLPTGWSKYARSSGSLTVRGSSFRRVAIREKYESLFARHQIDPSLEIDCHEFLGGFGSPARAGVEGRALLGAQPHDDHHDYLATEQSSS